ncbi:uncharacterized protein LOC135468137 [Liolophura sinensis]|uniref:uncharacterized protein LOC135468137 n=1 Tax=Liolophura sinensis TaxID=3198878 RepID=UPI003158FEB0
MLDFPIYAIHLENPSLASSFLSPPNPGLIAYLQRRHCVELTNKATMYLCTTPVHETMAEKAGVQHLKTSKVFQKPTMVKNNVMTVKCRSPELLHDLEIREPVDAVPGGRDPSDPHIPLLQEVISEDLCDHQVSADLGNGRREYLFVRDRSILTEYAELYKKNATHIGESASKVAKLCQMSPVDPDRSPASSPTATLRPCSTRSPRKIPSWMFSQKALKTHASSTSQNSPSDTYRHSRPSKKTMYVMTEAELVDVASRILKEAGKPLPSERLEASHFGVAPLPADDVRPTVKDQLTQYPDQPVIDSVAEETADRRDVTGLNTQVSSQPVGNVLDDLFSCGKSSTTRKKRKVKHSLKLHNDSPEQDTGDVSFVPDTVTMVPETITSSAQRRYSRDGTSPDLSVLDEIFS